jgi:hypothetical protein
VPAVPGTLAWPPRPAVDADFARDVGHLLGEGEQRVRHAVDRFGQRGHFAFGLDGQLLAQVAGRDRGHDLHDAAHLVGQVCRHDVDGVGEVLPGAGDVGHDGLPPSLPSVPTSRATRVHFGSERPELVDHRVDGVLELQNLALTSTVILRDRSPRGDRGRDFGDVADLRGEVRAHRVDGVGEVLPGAGDTGDDGLHAQAAFGADLAGDARDFRGERSAAARPSC